MSVLELPPLLDLRASLARQAADGPDTAELRPGATREELVAHNLFGAAASRVSFTPGTGDGKDLLFDGEPTRLKLAPRGLAVGPHVVARVDGSAGILRSQDWAIFTPRKLAALVVDELEALARPRPRLAELDGTPAASDEPLAQSMGLRVVDWGIDS